MLHLNNIGRYGSMLGHRSVTTRSPAASKAASTMKSRTFGADQHPIMSFGTTPVRDALKDAGMQTLNRDDIYAILGQQTGEVTSLRSLPKLRRGLSDAKSSIRRAAVSEAALEAYGARRDAVTEMTVERGAAALHQRIDSGAGMSSVAMRAFNRLNNTVPAARFQTMTPSHRAASLPRTNIASKKINEAEVRLKQMRQEIQTKATTDAVTAAGSTNLFRMAA